MGMAGLNEKDGWVPDQGPRVLTDEDCPPVDRKAPGIRLFNLDAERARERNKWLLFVNRMSG